MEPSSVEDGNDQEWTEFVSEQTASMEPSSVEDGNLLKDAADQTERVKASMEPSSVEDGNLACHCGF